MREVRTRKTSIVWKKSRYRQRRGTKIYTKSIDSLLSSKEPVEKRTSRRRTTRARKMKIKVEKERIIVERTQQYN